MNLANLDLLTRALRTLQATGNRARFSMAGWYGNGVTRLRDVPEADRSPDPTRPGFVGCLAAWCQALGARTAEERAMPAGLFAMEWLGLDAERAGPLFCGYWDKRVAQASLVGLPWLGGCLVLVHSFAGLPLAAITLEDALAHLESLRAGEAGEWEEPEAEEPDAVEAAPISPNLLEFEYLRPDEGTIPSSRHAPSYEPYLPLLHQLQALDGLVDA